MTIDSFRKCTFEFHVAHKCADASVFPAKGRVITKLGTQLAMVHDKQPEA